jgi:DNA-binding CsgD family transcriptional regulator
LLREAVTVLEHSAARLELAYALTDLGEQLSRARQRVAGRDALRTAIRLAGECGASTLTERARAELHAGPGCRARAELTGLGALTAAEWRVCREAAAGHTNRELAQALFVTEKTIERHLSSAYQKLGIRSRFQIAAAPVQLDKAGTTGYFSAIATTGPAEQATANLVSKLRSSVIPAAEKGTDIRAYVSGTTAGYADLASDISGKLPLQILVVIVLSFLLLILAFRTVVIPVQAALMNVLSIGAAYGVLTALFQWGWLHGAIG